MRTLIVLAVSLLSFAAQADELSTGQLLEFCTSKDEMIQTACRYFILGVVTGVEPGDGMVLSGRQFTERTKTHFCAPANLPGSEMVRTFVSYTNALLLKYPDDIKLPALSTFEFQTSLSLVIGGCRDHSFA
jgi:Rap1a immunity proteins